MGGWIQPAQMLGGFAAERVAPLYLRAGGALTLATGLLYFLAPATMAAPLGLDGFSPSGGVDLRASYGGIQLGLGLFLLWSATDASRWRSALVALALTLASVAGTRALGMLLEGVTPVVHVQATVLESLLFLATLAVLRRCPAAGKPGR